MAFPSLANGRLNAMNAPTSTAPVQAPRVTLIDRRATVWLFLIAVVCLGRSGRVSLISAASHRMTGSRTRR